MEQCPTWEANIRSAGPEMPRLLRNPKAHSFIHFPVVHIWNVGPLSRFLWSHTYKTRGKTPLDEWSARRRGLYLHRITQHKHKRQTSMPRAGFETTIPATERPQTYALDRVATGIGRKIITNYTEHRIWSPSSARKIHSCLLRSAR
jgi:hypothetical protein